MNAEVGQKGVKQGARERPKLGKEDTRVKWEKRCVTGEI